MALGLLGCAAERLRGEAQSQLRAGHFEEALRDYDDGLRRFPEDNSLRLDASRARDEAANRLLAEAMAERFAGRLDSAAATIQRLLKLRPDYAPAQVLLLDIGRDRREQTVMLEAREFITSGQLERAQLSVESGLRDDPRNTALLGLQRDIELGLREQRQSTAPRLADARPISLEFRDANLRMVLEALTRSGGTNFIVDKDVRPDLRVTIFLRQTRLEDAIDLLTATNQLAKKVLDSQTVLVYPNTPDKAREYQDLVIRAFHLSNSNVKQTAALLRTMLKIREPFIDEKLNLLVIRESPEIVRLADRLVALHDVSEGEVMFDLEVIEVADTRLTELGIQYPNSLNRRSFDWQIGWSRCTTCPRAR